MPILHYDIDQYCAAEKDLCEQHAVSHEEELIETELMRIHRRFATAYPYLKIRSDYEFPDWHHHVRLFWAYLYSDDFYNESFIPCIKQILAPLDRSWFAEFECYSPSLRSPELPSGYVGTFLVFKDTVMFCESDQWKTFKGRLCA